MLWCTHDASNVASCARRSVRVALRRQPYKRAVPNGFYLLMKHMLILEASTSRAAAAASTAVGHRLIPQGIEKAVSRTYTRSRARTYTLTHGSSLGTLCLLPALLLRSIASAKVLHSQLYSQQDFIRLLLPTFLFVLSQPVRELCCCCCCSDGFLLRDSESFCRCLTPQESKCFCLCAPVV